MLNAMCATGPVQQRHGALVRDGEQRALTRVGQPRSMTYKGSLSVSRSSLELEPFSECE